MPTRTIKFQMPDGSTRTATIEEAELQGVQSPELRQQYQADISNRSAQQLAAETSSGEAALVSAGKTATDLVGGAARLLSPAAVAGDTSYINQELEALQNQQPQQEDPVNALRAEKPLATLAGDIVPLAAVAGPANLLAQAGIGAAQGAALSAANNESAAGGAVAGAAAGALGFLAGRVLSRVLSPQATRSPTSSRTLKLAKDLGIRLTAGQRSGSPTARKVESRLRSNPASSRAFDELDAYNAAQLNRKALEAIGERGEAITDDVLESARLRLGQAFEDFGSSIQQVDANGPKFLNALADIEATAAETLDEGQFRLFKTQMDRVLDTFSRPVNGEAAVALRSQLDKTASRLFKSNGGAADSVKELTGAVEDLIFDNAPAKTRKEFAAMRQQWQNLRFLRSRNVVIDESLQPARLRQVIQTQAEQAYRLGRQEDNPLFKIARLQEGIRELVGNSGTSTRETQGVAERVLGHTVDAASAAARTSRVGSRALANQVFKPGGAPLNLMLNVGRGGGVGANERRQPMNIMEIDALLREGGKPELR